MSFWRATESSSGGGWLSAASFRASASARAAAWFSATRWSAVRASAATSNNAGGGPRDARLLRAGGGLLLRCHCDLDRADQIGQRLRRRQLRRRRERRETDGASGKASRFGLLRVNCHGDPLGLLQLGREPQ